MISADNKVLNNYIDYLKGHDIYLNKDQINFLQESSIDNINEKNLLKSGSKDANDIKSIIDSLPQYQRKFYNILPDEEYEPYCNDKYFIIYNKNIPVSFFILDCYDEIATISFATRYQYQNKGYGSKAIAKGIRYINSNLYKYKKIELVSLKTNKQSQLLAKKFGFNKDREFEDWMIYSIRGGKK